MRNAVNWNVVWEKKEDHTVAEAKVEGDRFKYTAAVRIPSGMCRVPRRESESLGLSGS